MILNDRIDTSVSVKLSKKGALFSVPADIITLDTGDTCIHEVLLALAMTCYNT